jgi:hypothetical protein
MKLYIHFFGVSCRTYNCFRMSFAEKGLSCHLVYFSLPHMYIKVLVLADHTFLVRINKFIFFPVSLTTYLKNCHQIAFYRPSFRNTDLSPSQICQF